jgi:hypothetical protein
VISQSILLLHTLLTKLKKKKTLITRQEKRERNENYKYKRWLPRRRCQYFNHQPVIKPSIASIYHANSIQPAEMGKTVDFFMKVVSNIIIIIYALSEEKKKKCLSYFFALCIFYFSFHINSK